MSEPGHPGRGFQVATHAHGDTYMDPDRWVAQVPRKAGSWWPEWQAWIARRSGGPGAPPSIGNQAAGLVPLGEAPGEYVLQK